jgi:hypothetical protein
VGGGSGVGVCDAPELAFAEQSPNSLGVQKPNAVVDVEELHDDLVKANASAAVGRTEPSWPLFVVMVRVEQESTRR